MVLLSHSPSVAPLQGPLTDVQQEDARWVHDEYGNADIDRALRDAQLDPNRRETSFEETLSLVRTAVHADALERTRALMDALTDSNPEFPVNRASAR